MISALPMMPTLPSPTNRAYLLPGAYQIPDTIRLHLPSDTNLLAQMKNSKMSLPYPHDDMGLDGDDAAMTQSPEQLQIAAETASSIISMTVLSTTTTTTTATANQHPSSSDMTVLVNPDSTST